MKYLSIFSHSAKELFLYLFFIVQMSKKHTVYQGNNQRLTIESYALTTKWKQGIRTDDGMNAEG